jgi:hypothetical protein
LKKEEVEFEKGLTRDDHESSAFRCNDCVKEGQKNIPASKKQSID